MKKLLRLFSSRGFLALLCVLLEGLQVTLVILLLREYFMPVNILGWVLQFAVLLYVINRDELPEFKLPWLFFLLVLPVTGAFLFLVFSSNEASKKQLRRHDAALDILRPYAGPDAPPEALREASSTGYAQATYLRRAARSFCHGDTAVTYYPLGDDFFPALLEALEGAERFILMEYFVIQEGRCWDQVHELLRRKAEAGLPVYVMYDDLGCVAKLPNRYDRTLQAEGIRALPANRLRPVFTKSHNNRDHRKIVVVDGRIGFTGGVNLSDRYMNLETVFGHWKDSAIRLEGPAVRNLTALFISSWNTQTDESIDPAVLMDPVAPVPGAAGFVTPFGDGPSPLFKDRVARNLYLDIIVNATEYVYITTPYLICDHELLAALRNAAKKGVDVRLITPHIPDKKAVFLMTRSNYAPLVADGVRVYEYTPGFIHAKNLVADGRVGVCGTVNLDYRSMVHNFENAVWMWDVPCLADMRDDFLSTVEVSEAVTPEQAGLRFLPRLAAELMKLLSLLM